MICRSVVLYDGDVDHEILKTYKIFIIKYVYQYLCVCHFVWVDGMAPRYNMQFSEKCIEIDRILANKCDVGYMRVCVCVWHCRQWRLLLAMLFMMLIIIWYARKDATYCWYRSHTLSVLHFGCWCICVRKKLFFLFIMLFIHMSRRVVCIWNI